jgi:hypothetical protein
MAGIHNYIREYSRPAHFYNIPTDHLGQRIIAAQPCLEYSHCSRILTTTMFCMLTSARQKYRRAKTFKNIHTYHFQYYTVYMNGITISGIFKAQSFQGYSHLSHILYIHGYTLLNFSRTLIDLQFIGYFS